jgi:Integrase zinc binding domain
MHHDSKFAGHPGINKTYRKVNKGEKEKVGFYDAHHYVSGCESCNKNKPKRQRPEGLLEAVKIPRVPMDLMTLDLVSGLNNEEVFYILVVVDKYSKQVWYIPYR